MRLNAVTSTILLVLLAAVCPGAELSPNPSSAASKKPNFIIILTDDQRADAMGCSGNPHIHTPSIDALAETGIRFTNAFVTTSICSPSRAALLTGCYGSVNSVRSLAKAFLADGVKTWPHTLRSAGYLTAHMGKWHLANTPESLGFEEAVFFESNGSYCGRSVQERGVWRTVEGHIDEYIIDQSINFMNQASRAGKPFALLICTQVPHMDDHFQWKARQETRERYHVQNMPLPPSWKDDLSGKPAYLRQARHRTRAIDAYGYDRKESVQSHIRDYYAAITDLDASLERVFQARRDLGLEGNTYVIFTSDNGWLMGEHRFTSKVLAYEESIRIPLIIAGPGIRPGADARLVLNIDIAPTLLSLADMPVSGRIQGASLVPALQGRDGDPWRTQIVYEAMESSLGSWPLLALRTERWKYILTFRPGTQPLEPDFEELYDLHIDSCEMRNMADHPEHSDTLKQMRGVLDEHTGR